MTDQRPTNSLPGFLDSEQAGESNHLESSAHDVGTRLAEAREAAGLTQTDVASHLGVKLATLQKWERGTASPRSNRLNALAGILGVSVSWLIVGFGHEPASTDGIDEIKVELTRLHAQLAETLKDVEMLVARLDDLHDAS